jgi:sugar transferase (PEP-CTERM/EpsH1 system associated)
LNILYITHRIPYPPTKGDKIRAFHQIRELARRHAVHLVCGIDAKDDVEGLKPLARYCASIEAVPSPRMAVRWRAARALLEGRSHTAFAHASPRLAERISRRHRRERFDAILVATVAVAETVRSITGIPKALDFVDLVSGLWEQMAERHGFPAGWLDRREGRRLARYEQEVARAFDCSIFASEAEAETFRRRGGNVPVEVVGNGVDLEFFCPPGTGPSSPVVVFTGTMDYFPNVDAVLYFSKAVLPRIRAVVPDTHFYIVGRDPTGSVRALARPGQVTVTGSVPDIRGHLGRAAVAVAPFRIARGIQNKILEAMAMGIPVVATSVALQGLAGTDGDGARRADDPEMFARETLALLQDPVWRRRCSQEARRYIERSHRWESQGARLNDILEAMVRTPCRPEARTRIE